MAEQNKTRWSKTTVTDDGVGLLTEFAAGRLLTITSAFGSVSDPGGNLVELTELPDGREHPLTIESVTKSDDGVTVCIQITSVGNQTAYKLEQIGIFAAVGDDAGQGGSAANEKLLMVIEDVEDENGGKGVTVPAENDQIYAFKLYAVLAITNKEQLEVSVSSAGIATVGAIEDAVKSHNASREAHCCIAARISAVETELNGGETVLANSAPDIGTEGTKGQHLIDQLTGTEYVCTDVTEEGYTWEPWETVDKTAFAAQSKLTGRPGQVVGFGADGAAEAVQGWSGRNLLINGDFRRPVNQQGKTEYAGTGYCIDRWKATVTGTVVALAGNGLRLTAPANKNAYLLQYFERPLSPGEYTLSALVPEVNGTGYIQIIYVDGTYGPATRISESGLFVVTAVATKEISRAVLQISAGRSIVFEAVKLELGPVQTLAHQDGDGNWVLNDPPDYDLQYALCSLYSPITGEWIGNQHSNPNLLDNWYFADPINQRGQAEYGAAGYTIDRWALKAGVSIKLLARDIEFSAPNSGDWNQILDGGFDLIKGKTFTISYLTMGNVLVFGSGTVPSNAPSATTLYLSASGEVRCALGYSTVHKHPFVSFAAGSKTSAKIVAVKLELGPVQTLAHQDKDGNWALNDPPPNKALELEKCQKYAIAMDGAEVRASRVTANAVRAFFPTPHSLRANPAITKGAFQVKSLSSGNMMTNAKWTVMAFETGILITATLEGHGQSDCTIFSNGVFLSSDL